MIELSANDWFTITNRKGVVFSFTPDKLPEQLAHPREMVDTIILVNGLPSLVKGIEHFVIQCPHPGGRCGHPFGLLVEPTSWARVEDLDKAAVRDSR